MTMISEQNFAAIVANSYSYFIIGRISYKKSEGSYLILIALKWNSKITYYNTKILHKDELNSTMSILLVSPILKVSPPLSVGDPLGVGDMR